MSETRDSSFFASMSTHRAIMRVSGLVRAVIEKSVTFGTSSDSLEASEKIDSSPE